MKFWEEVRKHNAELLASQINSKGGKAKATAESILQNLPSLVEKGESYGEETKFLRLDVMRALGSLCDTGRLVFRVELGSIRWENNGDSISLGGYLYEVRDDGTEVRVSGFSCGGAAREDVYSQDMMSNAQRQASMLSLASARAEKNAYFNAGIGIEYKGGDVFDLEAMESKIPAPEPVLPSPVSQEEKNAKQAAKASKKQDKPETTPEAEAAVPETSGTATTVAQQETLVTETAPTMSYEEAMQMAVDCGTYQGTPIGEILAKPQTARNIVWCFKQTPEGRTEKMKEALSVAIDGYSGGVLKKFL